VTRGGQAGLASRSPRDDSCVFGGSLGGDSGGEAEKEEKLNSNPSKCVPIVCPTTFFGLQPAQH